VTLIEDDDVIEAFAPDRADDALDIGVMIGGTAKPLQSIVSWVVIGYSSP
jgi:hypothetical protein